MPVDDEVGQRLELVAVELAVEAGSRAAGVVERHRARASERGRARDPDEGAVGTPTTSSTSASRRKKTGAMFT